MHGLMMPFQLTLAALAHRSGQLFAGRQVLSEQPDKTLVATTYAEVLCRARRLAGALRKLGLERGDRAATLCWNHVRHLECYVGITCGGFVLHTLNLRLHPDDLAYIAEHAQDRVIFVDEALLPLLEQFRGRITCPHFVVLRNPASQASLPAGCLDYEDLLADAAEMEYPSLDEEEAAALCYTSGTTGQPKGVLYSHRALTLHTLTFAMRDVADVGQADVLFPVVPMFHANCWGIPFVALMTGAKLILSGPHFDVPHLLEVFAKEKVTFAAGVPTIWLGVLQALDRGPGRHDLSKLRTVLVGGSAAPEGMIRGLQERHGIKIVQLWGMTEMSPLGTMCHLPANLLDAPLDEQYAYRARQGTPLPFVEVRARVGEREAPWDGKSSGELEVRGPWVASSYYQSPQGAASFTEDGWFRTGDIVAIDSTGCIQIQDRAKDLIKSGGEWISSVALENALMGHPCILEAAVVAVAHEKWQERPLACVVRKSGQSVDASALLEYLAARFARWWLPDAIVFVDEIPKTSAGKFSKKKLRDQYQGYLLSAPRGPNHEDHQHRAKDE